MFKSDANFSRRFEAFARIFTESRGTDHKALRNMRYMKHQSRLTSDLYRMWIDALALAGERSELRTVLEEMRKRGVTVDNTHYKRLMHAMSGFREFRACEDLARDMKAHRVKPSPEILEHVRSQPELRETLEILRADGPTPTSRPTQATPNATQASSVAQDLPAILGTQNTAQGIPNAIYDALAAKLTPRETQTNPSATQDTTSETHTAQAGSDATHEPTSPSDTLAAHLKKAIENATEKDVDKILGELRSMRANVALYNTIITRAPNERIAWSIFNGMVAHGVKPTVFTFNTLLRIRSAKGIKGSTDVLSAMKLHGVSPDVVTYNQLMQHRLEENDKQGFLAFWEMMKKKKVTPTITTYNQMLHLARKLRDREWHEEAKEELKKSGVETNAATRQLLQDPENPHYWLN